MSGPNPLVRYTFPERLSSRVSLQLVPPQTSAQAIPPLTTWTELHPSRRLPAYAIQPILEAGHELSKNPSRQLVRTLTCEADPVRALDNLSAKGLPSPADLVFASPLIVEECIIGESLTEVLKLASSRGWPELPVPVALGAFISVARGLAHLHALGFTHGGISSEAVNIRYAAQDEQSVLVQHNQSGGALLSGWINGQLFQLSSEGERYGRGPAADCKALLYVLLEMLGGESTLVQHAGTVIPASSFTEAQLSPRNQEALQQLSPQFAGWVQEALITPPPHMGAMLSQLQRVLDPSQPAFDGPGLSRWLTRLAPEKAMQWEQLLTTFDGQSLQLLSPIGGVLTYHRDSTSSLASPQGSETSTSRAKTQNLVHQPSTAPQASTSPKTSQDQPTSLKDRRSKKRSSTPPVEGGWLARLDHQLNQFEDRLQAPFIPSHGSVLQLRVAFLWRDTITELHELSLKNVITLSDGEGATLHMPRSPLGSGVVPLFSPSTNGEVVVHGKKGLKGWVKTKSDGQRHTWDSLSSPELHTIEVGGMGVLIDGDVGLFFHLQRVPPKPPVWLPTLPIPTQEAGFIWCLAFALVAHLSFITASYSSRTYQYRERALILDSKFVEVLTQQQKDKEAEKDEEEEEELEEEFIEEIAEADDSYTPAEPPPEPSKIREAVKQLSEKRFGQGKQRVEALADFLTGQSSSEGKLALGDVSAALGTSEDSGLSLGSSFGEVGGTLQAGGGGGSLDTSGGLASSRSAGRLKAKKRKGKVRGRVKTLKSRIRTTGGSLSKAAVSKVIRKHIAKINACYESQLRTSPQLSGKLTVSWVINTNGSVSNVRQVLASIKSPALVKCAFKIIKRMRFPKPKGGKVKIKYPFVFQRG